MIACSGTGGVAFRTLRTPDERQHGREEDQDEPDDEEREPEVERQREGGGHGRQEEADGVHGRRDRRPRAGPTPTPSAPAFRFISVAASSTSSPASAFAWSATRFAASPTEAWPFAVLVTRVGMAPPVEDLGEEDAEGERGADDEERVRAAAPLLGPVELRARRRPRRALGRLPSVGSSPLIRFAIRLGLSLRTKAASSASGCAAFSATPPRSAALSAVFCSVSAAFSTASSPTAIYFFTGGGSPVVTRQILDATVRAATVAAAAIAA